jgi:hypothetical protein
MNKVWLTRDLEMSQPQTIIYLLRKLPEYTLCVILGLVGGAAGVALAIGLTILLQLLLPSGQGLSIRIVPLMVVAAIMGLMASWLLGKLIRRPSLPLRRDHYQMGLQVTLVLSVFTSLLQTLLFFLQG